MVYRVMNELQFSLHAHPSPTWNTFKEGIGTYQAGSLNVKGLVEYSYHTQKEHSQKRVVSSEE